MKYVSIFKGNCPRCGHRSVYYSPGAGRDACGWPDCDWPNEPRDHYHGLRLHPDGTATMFKSRIEKSADE